MRLAVLDVGSNTVHLLIVDARYGGAPLPATSSKYELRLAEHLTDDGNISDHGADRLVEIVQESQATAERHAADSFLGFATSAVREAPNGDDLLKRIQTTTGVELTVMPGIDEARSTFLAARRWFGWSAGTMLGLDIGGGSLEIAIGLDEEPDFATSLPLGAGRLTRQFFTEASAHTPDPTEVANLRKHVVRNLAENRRDIRKFADPDLVVGSSKTFRTLARATGAASSSEGIYVPRHLRRDKLEELVARLETMPVDQRAELPGVSLSRAPQLLAGAIVASEAMTAMNVEKMAISPWALREGLILQYLDTLPDDIQPVVNELKN